MSYDPRRVKDIECAIDSTPSTSAPSVLGSPLRLHSPLPVYWTPPPSLETTTLDTVGDVAGFIARVAFHLLTFTGGLYLASTVFTSLAPLLEESWIWTPPVFVACALAMMMAPFWGLLVLHFLPSKPNWDGHTRKCLASIGVGLGLAGIRVLIVLGTLVHATLPCHEVTLACAADSALAVTQSLRTAPTNKVATSIAVSLVPLACAWWYTSRKKTIGYYVFMALKAAGVGLALVNVWLVVAVGSENDAMRNELGKCRNRTEGQVPVSL
ncbi:hypothetical protein CcaverHIS002_0703520 [Cutaneotrichosporon cavernicola]|uniref:Uncharacterized protein n=1 Tax=Cutaneotrichosporon cavernicola TaxID=279322 RepID=A0AA48LA44_9TREE|nr:uncharacterized protein CcaverHIS019_0703590 [Cutaneotrichosporon cavernicola]BEI87006.1 hypothetical protein CcaverHIS002_0703520 [Cutaneotrichosporon cavernicola]BEI94778.1 hypothetical protein CcaverHIS019_0703590 [Cutaneotrichosporon cavernicola]BEJ02553.1 hypothetical protein CcaverHIS631_0703480 [Cutaneotrichosporon cavernicola]BEJ10310.1 hypothetical protein CcaverHIS641_0703450 [Cutaneotrichosporon cavernicola]